MDVVLCWHMHQPDYRLDGRYLKPWTWLHAIKDYSDMAAHLESVPGARAVVNFSPVLIEQLKDYPHRIRSLLADGEPAGDMLLDALAGKWPEDRRPLLAQLLRVNEERMKDRFEPYARLFDRAQSALSGGTPMDDGTVRDLLAWYVVAWLGESLRNTLIVEKLAAKAGDFSPQDLRSLLQFVAEIIEGLLPRYRALAESGVIELSVTPYAHPILPLMLDFESARDAMPEVTLPMDAYPGGEARCDWHLAEAVSCFRETFGHAPAGCWPSEGALSQATLQALGRHGFRWTASGSQVLNNSLRREGSDDTPLPQLQAWQPGDERLPACFFRDDGHSDLIGFEYSKWQAEDAVDDFIARLESLREESLRHGNSHPVLSIIMDGENAWEYFVENGWEFLQSLYHRLAEHPDFHLTTFSSALEHGEPGALPGLCAGSWVYGNFSTWVGEPAKNLAWVMLASAKRAVDSSLEQQARKSEPEWDRRVLRQLAICEASDWFWWLGENNQLIDGPEFENMFRNQLCALYRLLDLDVPLDLVNPSVGLHRVQRQAAADTSGAMRRSGTPEAAD